MSQFRALAGLLFICVLAFVAPTFASDEETFLVRRILPLNETAPQGAYCLDGSAPGYYWRAGTGSGTHYESILVHFSVLNFTSFR